MPIGCKGICKRLEFVGGGKISVYELGFKRCTGCNIYLRYDGVRCPCCKYVLRSKSRTGKMVESFPLQY